MLLWIIGILIVLAVWVIWLLFPPAEPGGSEFLPLWLAVTITVVIMGALIALWVVRRVRAARAARALEKAIAQQAQEDALKAKPEEREEIQALYRQLAEGIAALKQSKLGGGRSGADALYALPWYAIVGPPGAGKTTALRYSGLQFPFLDPGGAGVRGVGGTRNCDWWFTNEAILLDTAGRYTTEVDDNDEWVAFLEQLMKYRPEKPLNGVIVAISVAELLDATDEQIQQTAGKVRARIEEMQTTLKMSLPVYVFFTKSDLVAGFTEFFGDLKKSDRGQPWGATYNLGESKAEPGKLFEREFDILVEALHARVTRRVSNERSRSVKERVYQFPLEFAGIKYNLQSFMQATFAPAGGGAQPMLRGFYFTSGTQEGKPLDRIVGAMGRAFGLKGSVAEESDAPKESKSYFLRDVFMNIIFPDAVLASLSQVEVRRRLFQKLAIAAAASFLAVVFCVPAVISFMNNRELVNETGRITTAAAEVDWRAGGGAAAKVDRLTDLRNQLEKLRDWENNGAPIAYSWFMYEGDTLYTPVVDQYKYTLNEGFMKPTKEKLEEKVDAIKGDPYLEDYNNLKTYLLLNDREHLQDEEAFRFQVARLTQIWAEVLRPNAQDISEADLKAKLFPHVQTFVQLQREGKISGVPTDTKRIESARQRLKAADQVKAYYELFVVARNDDIIDPAGDTTAIENKKYPPITLDLLFLDREELKGQNGVLSSKSFRYNGQWGKIRGAYTAAAFQEIDKLLSDEGAKLLEREAWVVPYTDDEKQQGDRIKQAIKRVRQRYEDDYISEWEAFFRDVDVKVPVNNGEAILEFKLLSTPEWAYKRLLQTLTDNTQFVDTSKEKLGSQLAGDGGVIDQIQKRVERRFTAQSGLKFEELQSAMDLPSQERIKRHFKSMCDFGVPPPYIPPPKSPEGQAPAPAKAPPDPELIKYIGHLETLKGEMQVLEEGPPNTETKNATELFTKAVKESEQMLLKMDRTGQALMEPLLMNPLRQGYKAFVKGAGGAASGLWEVMVWPNYREKIKDRYPFNLSAKRDASYADMVAFFKPQEGTLWGFYGKYLQNFHMKQDHDFIPVAFLQGKVSKGKPFTPFNPLMYNCLKRADEITDALWPDGKTGDPNVEFQINLKTVSPIVSDVIFEVDGQKRAYRNEKEFWYSFKWPGAEKQGARIQVRGAGGLDEEIVRDGPWGVFRLFESADRITAVKGDDKEFLVTWTMSAPPVSVTMQVRPKRGNHPFPTSFFRGTNCPPSIGDKFGGGAGDAAPAAEKK